MRYMAKVLRDALHGKFPQAPEKDVLKIVGNLIYYRYINSAIVAPDAFDIIDVTAHKGLTNDQRRNLGSVAKILQFAASNKGVSAALVLPEVRLEVEEIDCSVFASRSLQLCQVLDTTVDTSRCHLRPISQHMESLKNVAVKCENAVMQ